MNILIVGTDAHAEEAKAKFSTHTLLHTRHHAGIGEYLHSCDVVFDFIVDHDAKQLVHYKTEKPKTVFLNSVFTSLRELQLPADGPVTFFGFNGMPTFFNRPILEITLQQENQSKKAAEVCSALGTEYQVVKDAVGMVTPRVVCMIINEAYFTVEEGTATREDIDLAMKLGTSYPYGPFEWCERIGIRNVCGLLEAVLQDTRDERYQICRLLKTELKS